jgi:hypothetical protein
MLKYLRLIHFYLGVFFAPTIIFFAFSGMLQTFSFHENHDGKPGIPWVTALSEVHKNQRVPNTWTAKEPAPQPVAKPITAAPTADKSAKPTATSASPTSNPAPPKRRPKSFALKVFVGLMSEGLILTSLLGIYMAFKYARGPLLICGLLIAGTSLPIALLYM